MDPAAQSLNTNNSQQASNQVLDNLKQKLAAVQVPPDVAEKLQDDFSRVELVFKTGDFTPEFDRQISYINFVTDLPWNKAGQDILDLNRAKQVLDKNHYGLETIKARILEYLSIMILNHMKGQVAKQPILAFVGLVGSGKTSLAFSIAESLGRPLIRIPFGGLGSALQLRGESRVKSEAEPGLIMRALKRAQVKNPVILLDELDRVTELARADIMGVLVELLDPEQNMAFLDHYVNFPFDLSQVLFVATANNTGNIATAVMDRLEVIEMPFYTDEQKVVIGRDYIMPETLKNAAIDPRFIQIDPKVWENIVRPLGFDGGIRSLKRHIVNMVGKIARMVVEGQKGPFVINEQNIQQYLNT
ncbi:MAG TPA: AAA family ATPase [Patescibacteria group bacterium]|nr:AAA family ATPase [Patescibacteria group bacterium]